MPQLRIPLYASTWRAECRRRAGCVLPVVRVDDVDASLVTDPATRESATTPAQMTRPRDIDLFAMRIDQIPVTWLEQLSVDEIGKLSPVRISDDPFKIDRITLARLVLWYERISVVLQGIEFLCDAADEISAMFGSDEDELIEPLVRATAFARAILAAHEDA